MREDEKRAQQQATKFAAKQERSSAPKVQGASKVQGAPKGPSNLAPKPYSAAPKPYSAGQNSPLRQKGRRLDGKESVIGQSANNRTIGQPQLQPSAAIPSRNVAETVADFTAGGIDRGIIDDQLEGAEDEEKDLFDDIFGLDDEDEDEYNFNPNYLA